jgi:hypothetical protein
VTSISEDDCVRSLHYVPEVEPFTDFAVAVHVSPHAAAAAETTLRRIGVEVRHLGPRVPECLLITSDTTDQTASAMAFSGIAFGDGELITSRADASHHVQQRGALRMHGQYALVGIGPDGALFIENDVFGMCPLYHYRSGRNEIVSNRLHLILEVAKALDWPLTICDEALLTRLLPLRFGQQPCTPRIYFRQVHLVPVGATCRVNKHNGVVDMAWDSGARFSRYEDAIQHAADQILSQARLLCSRYTVLYRLSGGWDSRIVYGALLRGGLQKDTYCWTFPERRDDFRVVCGLIKMFGGKFTNSPIWMNNTVPQDLMTAFRRFRSRQLGCYNLDRGFMSHYRRSFGPNPTLVLLGGGGECFRRVYFKDLQDDARPQDLEKRIVKMLDRFHPLAPFSRELASTFRRALLSMPADNVPESLRLHYLNFRNRFHHGHALSPANCLYLHPLMQASLLEASRLAGPRATSQGKVHFDLQAIADQRLPHLPFDLPGKQFSRELATELQFAGAEQARLEFDMDESVYRPIRLPVEAPPALFRGAEKRALWKEAFSHAYERMRSYKLFRRICSAEFRDYILGFERLKPEYYYPWTTSVIGTSDLLDIAESK